MHRTLLIAMIRLLTVRCLLDRRRRLLVPTRSGFPKRHFDRLRNHSVDATTIAKPNFKLGGMRVCVDASRVYGQTQNISRIATVKQYIAIRMPGSVSQRLVTNAAPIDEPVLHVGLTSIKGWQAEPAGNCDAVGFSLDVHRLLRETVAENLAESPQAFLI